MSARSACIICLTLAFASPTGGQPRPRNILLLNSLQRDSFTSHNEIFRAELRRLVPGPLNFFEVLVRPDPLGQAPEEPLVAYLRSTVMLAQVDLVVSVGGPAAQFVRTHRQRLFPATPILESSLDVRWLRRQTLSRNETAVAAAYDFPALIENILVVRPDTARVVVVMGSSPLEMFWRDELIREFERFKGRLAFEWLNGLSLQQILERTSALPAHSAIFYPVFSLDGAGVAHSEDQVLAQLHAVSTAPIFGLYDLQVGRGIVGGPLSSLTESAKKAAAVAGRVLGGESPADITTPPLVLGPPAYDWRELQRWGVSEARLPRGSTVHFRPAGVWAQYRYYIVVAGFVFAMQTALITGLSIQRARRRRTELALRDSELRFRATAERNQDLAGRLITSQEDERSRIARDLHDDVSQQLAGVSIMLSGLKRTVATPGSRSDIAPAVGALQERTSALAETVRNLSHELHPGVLEYAGLVATLKRHCAEVAAHHHLTVTFSGGGDLESLTPAMALCLFRVTQEALSNAVRHADARTIGVKVAAGGDTVRLEVTDDGIGFVVADRSGTGLGLRSIDERVRFAGGSAHWESQPGGGTTVRVSIPLPAADDTSTSPNAQPSAATATAAIGSASRGHAT